MLKKILFSILATLIFLVPLAKPVAAQQGTWYNQPFGEWYLKVYDDTNPQEIFGERYTAAQVQWIMWSIPAVTINTIFGSNTKMIGCYLGSFSGVADLNACLPDFRDFFQSLKGVLDNNTSGFDYRNSNLAQIWFKEKPLNSVTYVKNLAQNIHLIPQADAATTVQNKATGFNYLNPVANLWKITRNMAFGIFVIAIIAFSFMIMFRVKISPQVVISVQSALPKIIFAMILVTFSYAIAGFLIDLSYIITGFMALMLNAGGGNGTTGWYYGFMTGNLFGVDVSRLGEITNINNLLGGPIQIIVYFVLYLVFFIVTAILFTAALALKGSIGGALLGAMLVIFGIIMIIILIINIFRLLFLLLKTVANIFLFTILAPIMISAGVLFQGMGFSSWLKKMLSNVLVFPAVGILFFFSFRFLITAYVAIFQTLAEGSTIELAVSIFEGITSIVPGETVSLTNFVGSYAEGYHEWQVPFMGPGTGALALILMSAMVMMLIPKVGKMIEGFFSGRPMDMESAIGEALGPVKSLGRTGSEIVQRQVSPKAGAGLEALFRKLRINEQGRLGKILYGGSNALKSPESRPGSTSGTVVGQDEVRPK